MKLVIQIPCFNEENTIATTLSDLPRQLDGIDEIIWLIVDDGSRDDTVGAARKAGADIIVSHPKNMGLAQAFQTGLSESLKLGADIIVNTDADNQYNADDIPALIKPIIDKKADIVVGARPISQIESFSRVKKCLQKIGSWAVRVASKTDIPDAPSGFRAISRKAAMRINVFSEYTYTLETIIQAGQKGMAITSTPVRTNEKTRESRLVKSITSYVRRSILTIVRIFMTYKPLRFFAIPGFVLFLLGVLTGVRFLYFYFTGDGAGHIQSIVLCTLLVGLGFHLILMGLLGDLIAVNRKLLEDLKWRIQQLENNKIGE